MSRLAVFMVDGFEEIEALTVVDLARRAGIEVDVVSVMEEEKVCGSHKIPVICDMHISKPVPVTFSPPPKVFSIAQEMRIRELIGCKIRGAATLSGTRR